LVLPFRRLATALAVGLPFLISSPVASAATVQANATITINDQGISPASVTIAQGGSVTFQNNGGNVHSATSGSAPISFDTGGLGPGQSASFSFPLPGTYTYTSAPDCLGGNSTPNFNCGPFQIIVSTQPANATTAPAPVAPGPPSAAPGGAAPVAPGTLQQNATVTITDKGISPTSVSIALNGSVTFANNGNNVHTATTTGGNNPVPFDTGGLATGQNSSQTFSLPGTYTYTSATDCLNGNSTPAFACGPYTIVVGSEAVTSPAASAPAAVPAGSSAASAAPVASAAAPSGQPQNATVILTEQNGFQPNTVTIQHGATVTWINQGTQVHTVTSNPGYYNAFDSGGLDPGKSFSYNFTIPGTYGYHSATEPQYTTDQTTQSTVVTYTYNGTVIVQ
jgi:plastocyanin